MWKTWSSRHFNLLPFKKLWWVHFARRTICSTNILPITVKGCNLASPIILSQRYLANAQTLKTDFLYGGLDKEEHEPWDWNSILVLILASFPKKTPRRDVKKKEITLQHSVLFLFSLWTPLLFQKCVGCSQFCKSPADENKRGSVLPLSG